MAQTRRTSNIQHRTLENSPTKNPVMNLKLLVFGVLLTFASNFGQTFFISLFSSELMDAYGLSHSSYGAFYSAATLLSALCLLWSGKQVDNHSLPAVTAVALLGVASGCLMLGLGQHLVWLFLGLFLLRQCGQALIGHISSTTMSRYFDHLRGRALSISVLGYPIGEALLPSLIVALLAWIGWQGSWLAVAAFVLFVLLPAALFLLRNQQLTPVDACSSDIGHQASNISRRPQKQWTRKEVIRDPAFWLLLPAATCIAFIITGLFFHQVAIAELKSWSNGLRAASFIAFASCQISTSLLMGELIDRYTALHCARWFLIPLTLAAAVLAIFDGNASIWLYMGLAGIGVGSGASLSTALFSETYGVRHIGAIRSIALAAMVFVTAVSPVLYGAALDAGVTATGIGWLSAGYTIFALAVAQIALQIYRKRIQADKLRFYLHAKPSTDKP